MAKLLKDAEILKLIGTVIIDGDAESVRPNSYILRLGAAGEFINTNKEFSIGDKRKKGIKVQPGHSVGVTALETIDFTRATVRKFYPEHDLHAIISPTTDLSREGIVAPTTQVDAGYAGTLNWTLTNTSSDERRFMYRERLFRLTILKLDPDETPDQVYGGSYQRQTGYVRSKRQGAPVGMRDSEWEDAQTKGSPEDLLENLIKAGYPWHVLGQRLKLVDQQFQAVTNEYSELQDAIGNLRTDVNRIRDDQAQVPDRIRTVLRDEASSLQNRWLIGAGSLIFAAIGSVVSIAANERAFAFVRDNGVVLGVLMLLASAIALALMAARTRK